MVGVGESAVCKRARAAQCADGITGDDAADVLDHGLERRSGESRQCV